MFRKCPDAPAKVTRTLPASGSLDRSPTDARAPLPTARSGRPTLPLAEAIRRRCLERGWDRRELARRAGVSRTTLHHLLAGLTRRPHLATLSRLAAALGLRSDELAIDESRRPAGDVQPFASAGSDSRAAFDRLTNPAVVEVSRTRPELFDGWSGEDWDELYSTFGVGGNLSPDGVVASAQAINDRRETTRKLHLVLETHLGEVARNFVETLYAMVHPGATAPIAPPSVSPESERREAGSAIGDA